MTLQHGEKGEQQPVDALTPTPYQGRRHVRRRIAGGYITYLDAASTQHRGEILDVGLGGVAFRGWQLLRGFFTTVRLELPGVQRLIQSRGQIVWTDATGRAGVRFLSLPPESETCLQEWLAHRPEGPGESHRAGQARQASAAMVPHKRGQTRGPADRILALAAFGWRALALTGIDGLAVALPEGGEIVCAASFGLAPPPGVIIQPDSGLAGECLKNAQLVHCRDAARDPRVPPRVAAQGFRSAVFIPVLEGAGAVGLIAAFSRHPNAFRDDHIALLQALEELLRPIPSVLLMLNSPPDPEGGGTRAQPLPGRALGSNPDVANQSRSQALPLPGNRLALRHLGGAPAEPAEDAAEDALADWAEEREWRLRAGMMGITGVWASFIVRTERARRALAMALSRMRLVPPNPAPKEQ